MNRNRRIWSAIFTTVFTSLSFTMLFSKIFNKQPIEGFNISDSEDEGHVNFQVLLGSGERYVNTDKFKEANLKCRFGGIEVYFNNASLDGGKGIIRIDSSFGGIELYIPKEWTVVNDLRVGMGAVEFKNEGEANPDKVIRLLGNVSVGAVEITYV